MVQAVEALNAANHAHDQAISAALTANQAAIDLLDYLDSNGSR